MAEAPAAQISAQPGLQLWLIGKAIISVVNKACLLTESHPHI